MRLFAVLLALALVAAQSSSPSTTTSPSLTLSLTTSSRTTTFTTRTQNQNSLVTTVLPTVFNVTRTVAPSSSSSTSSLSATSSLPASPTPSPIVLETKLDPAFGVLGAVLILSGLPSAFWGHKNRWTSFFLIGFYTLSLVCFVLILKFGILAAVNPPSKTLRGMFVLASAIAGFAGGAIAIFFWKAARYAIGAWGGFALGLWIQCFHNGGLIKGVGFRWILYIGCAVIGFILCTIPKASPYLCVSIIHNQRNNYLKIHYHILLISTAFVGSSAFMLGVDCYTTAGLKEFYVWNLGFKSLFPKFTSNSIEFPVSQIMQIELGLIGAVALMGASVQLRILSVLHRKLDEISEEQKKRDADAEAHAAEMFNEVKREQAEWEAQHPTLPRHGRQESGASTLPAKDLDQSSTFTLVTDAHARRHSNVSDFKAAPTPDEELRRAARNMQNPGALPALDLGLGIQEDVPAGFIASDETQVQNQVEDLRRKELSPAELEELKRKESLILEIQTIRRSIEALKSETPAPSSSSASRHPSITSRRTLSIDASNALLPIPAHLRPPRETNPRARAHSMEFSSFGYLSPPGDPLNRPTSVPARDEEWETYVHERKLLQPPSGVTPPIATTVSPAVSPRHPIAPAVSEALNKRKQRENALGAGGDRHSTDSSEDVPLSQLAKHQRNASGGNNIPVTILAPRRNSAVLSPIPQRPDVTRTRTFEELNERHREKMRDLQAPLTQAEKEEADIRAARQRWEKNKAVEREAVMRRQAEKASQHEKERRKQSEDNGERKDQKSPTGGADGRHLRSLSRDRLARGASSSKRLSTMKVEDWQRYQEAEPNAKLDATTSSGSDSRRYSRDSRPLLSPGGVPFPDSKKRHSGQR